MLLYPISLEKHLSENCTYSKDLSPYKYSEPVFSGASVAVTSVLQEGTVGKFFFFFFLT